MIAVNTSTSDLVATDYSWDGLHPPEKSGVETLAGLTSDEAKRRLNEFGTNTVAEERAPAWRAYLAKYWAPIPWLLEIAIALQVGLGDYVEAAVVAALLIFNATLAFIQEGRAGAAIAALKKRLAPTAIVLRDGEWVRTDASQLVPGDAVRLPLGAMVPADARIVIGVVMVDQSMLTGESVPIDALPGSTVFAGALVRRGQAIAEVTATGTKTYFGRTAQLVQTAKSKSTEQAAIFAVTRNLAVVNGVVALTIIAAAYVMALPSHDLIRLALTALLATIPIALPATFTLSAAFGAQALAKCGVLLTRLSAAHEGASMDVLCVDKTGTLTRNELEVVEVSVLPGYDRETVLGYAAHASSVADQDPIDNAIQVAAAGATGHQANGRLVRFVPFDPTTRMSEAVVDREDGSSLRIVKGAFQTVAGLAAVPTDASALANDLGARGHRVIAVAAGASNSLRLAGLIAISDPPREESAQLVETLRTMGVRTLMVTGDSAVTAAAIAHRVGITGAVYPDEKVPSKLSAEEFSIFARVVPEQKFELVRALQRAGHVVGMCGDGTNDAPALRQAQIGIAVASATDVAKAAARVVLTEPGLAEIVSTVREGRIVFQRMLTYTFNMLVKKFEIVLFMAIGLIMTGDAVMTPALMVLVFMTNDFLSMSLTTDRATGAPVPSKWRMRNITLAGVAIGVCKLASSTGLLAVGKFRLGLDAGGLQTLSFVILVFGNQSLLYVLRERRRLWSSMPSKWVLASSVVDVGIVLVLAFVGLLMEPLPWSVLAAVAVAAIGFALILDEIKLPIRAALKIA
jgi:H+-transporting ATPase